MDKSKLRPRINFLEKTGLIYQISLEDFYGGWQIYATLQSLSIHSYERVWGK